MNVCSASVTEMNAFIYCLTTAAVTKAFALTFVYAGLTYLRLIDKSSRWTLKILTDMNKIRLVKRV